MPKQNKKQMLPTECYGALSVSVDEERFFGARELVLAERAKCGGIGTLSEKTLHKILKYYVEPNEEYHEVEYLGSVLDIKGENGIFEIQTRAYDKILRIARTIADLDESDNIELQHVTEAVQYRSLDRKFWNN